MITLSRAAERQVGALFRHYARKGRSDAAIRLVAALDEAMKRIERDSAGGSPAPRPYPTLARARLLWIKVGRYWFAYSRTTPTVLTAVFYDAADIPRRLGR